MAKTCRVDKAGNDNMSDAKGVNTQLNRAPTISNPTVSRVSNSTSELTITATATDQDENDVLTYKLLRGTSANDANPVELSLAPEKVEGRTVIFKDTGLSMDTYYWYKIKVSDGIDSIISSNYGSERTYCEGQYCAGGYYTYPSCTNCNGNGNTVCIVCGGNGSITNQVICNSCAGSGSNRVLCTSKWDKTQDNGGSCPQCGNGGFVNTTYFCSVCGQSRTSQWCAGCGYRQAAGDHGMVYSGNCDTCNRFRKSECFS